MLRTPLSTYESDMPILEWGARYYPEIRFNYGPISLDNIAGYLKMIERLKELRAISTSNL